MKNIKDSGYLSDNDDITIPRSSYYNNSCAPIFINGTATGVGAQNWSWAASQPWCTLNVDTYYIENITIDYYPNHLIEIRDSNVNFTIRNCTLINALSGSSGIYLYNVSNGLIENNNCSNNSGDGISIGSYCYSNTILNNTCVNNDNGISLENNCDSNVIENNTCYDNDNGISLNNDCDSNVIGNNTCANNDNGISLEYGSSSNELNDNNCSFNLDNGISLENNCDSNVIENNTCYDNSDGISLENNCDSNVIGNNTCSYNTDVGIQLIRTSGNVIENNTCSYNTDDGIELYNDCDSNVIGNNTCYDNSDGISLYNDCDSNVIENNTCANNDNGISLEYGSSSNELNDNNCSFNLDNGISLYNDCDSNVIENNTCYDNSDGISLEYGSSSNELNDNICSFNLDNGISLEYGSSNELNDNICSFNLDNGISLESGSNNNTINNNTCNSNTNDGVKILGTSSNYCLNNTITRSTASYNGLHGIYLTYNRNFNISDNIAQSNQNGAGIYIEICGRTEPFFITISFNVLNLNMYGIYLFTSLYCIISYNEAEQNSKYGILLMGTSINNTIDQNDVFNNGIYCISYNDASSSNTFGTNGGCVPKSLTELLDNGDGDGAPGDYGFIMIIIIVAINVGLISSISYLGMFKRKKLRAYGIDPNKQHSIYFMRDGVAFDSSEHETKTDFVIPLEVKPYEFYCVNCQNKSIGYEIFCPTCGNRMKLYETVVSASKESNAPTMTSTLASKSASSAIEKGEKKEFGLCALCHSARCPKCKSNMNGPDSCYEECPYCEKSYHEHCWINTIKSFGKCGFCLETPPPELMPRD